MVDREAIQARADAATPGPFDHLYAEQCCGAGDCVDPVIHAADLGYSDAAFIAYCGTHRDAIVALTEQAAADRAAVEAVRALHQLTYLTTSDEVWKTNPQCTCGHGWPCVNTDALGATS